MAKTFTVEEEKQMVQRELIKEEGHLDGLRSELLGSLTNEANQAIGKTWPDYRWYWARSSAVVEKEIDMAEYHIKILKERLQSLEKIQVVDGSMFDDLEVDLEF